MPKRILTFRVEASEVQGEGSWVELRYLTYGEHQVSLKGKGDDQELLRNHVVDWNWVDSEGKPFGKPAECIDDLFMSERWFLLGKLFTPNSEAAVKNSSTG